MRTLSDSTVDSSQQDKGFAQLQCEVTRAKREMSLVRKYDVWLLPTLILMCLFQAIDKSLIGIAKIDGIEADLGLTQTQLNVAISIFQVGYLLLQVPSNLLITRVQPSVYLPLCCFAWSTVAACHVIVRDYTGLIAIRILLGICDAPFWVGAVHLLSSWYTKNELVSRMSILLAATIIAFVAISPMSAIIIQKLEGRNDWRGWRWLYLIFGLGGFAPALFGIFTLPDYPHSHKNRFWLSKFEQELARKRMEEDRIGEAQVKQQNLRTGFKDAIKDTRTWIFMLMIMSRKSLEGLLYYLPALVKSFHLFSRSHLTRNTVALLLNSPPALLAAVLALCLGYTSNRYKERTFHIAIPLMFALSALVVSAATNDAIVRYVCMYFYLGGNVSLSGIVWSWLPNAIQETPEKKACAIAIVSVFGGLGSVWAPFLFRKQDYPSYRLAFIVIGSFVAVEIGCCLWMRHVLKKRNQRMELEGRNLGGSINYQQSQAHLL